jgi:hypothetical protein
MRHAVASPHGPHRPKSSNGDGFHAARALPHPHWSATHTRFDVTHMPIKRFLLLLALAPALAACEDPGGGGRTADEDELVFIQAAPDAPPLTTYDTTFWAVKGRDTELRIDYKVGAYSRPECLRFRVRDDALLRRPDGSTIREGDSVQIRVRVVNSGVFNFEFSPAGLKFDPKEPAELRVNYAYADPDFDGDGDVDDDDEDFEFGWWRQEAPGLRWERMGSVRVHDAEEVRADVTGFTRYALAGGH